MNLIFKLLIEFFKTEKINALFLLISGILVSIVQTYGISKNVAQIIDAVQSGHYTEIDMLIKLFVGLCALFVFFNYLYESFKTSVLTKLRQWIRAELIRILMKTNNENFTDKNFIKLNSPINRISNVAHLFMNDLFTHFVPSIIFIFVVFVYFTYTDPKMGAVFIFANAVIFAYLFAIIPTILKLDKEYETNVNENEAHVLELLNNMDKIVYRGQTQQETARFKKITEDTTKKTTEFFQYMNFQETLMSSFVYVIVVLFIIYIIAKVKTRKLSKVVFITLMTIIMLYKDKLMAVIWQISGFIEFAGRANGVLEYYNDAVNSVEKRAPTAATTTATTDFDRFFSVTEYVPIKLKFNKIEFKNVSFKYRTKDTYVFKNLNLTLFLDNKIIGLTGVSGRGKSTLMKLALKMYNNYDGDILIDNVNIRKIDPDYLRKNIVYVNQNSKLFDRTIIDNIMYGCPHDKTCDRNIREIMSKYPKIKSLFKDNDIHTTRVGPLGEKMSGGQRMIISILTGLISPESCGLVLDEPTTGLDPELKTEIIDLIRENREKKKFIIVISHDKDIYRIFDEKKEI